MQNLISFRVLRICLKLLHNAGAPHQGGASQALNMGRSGIGKPNNCENNPCITSKSVLIIYAVTEICHTWRQKL